MLNTSFNTSEFLSARVDAQKTAAAACESYRNAIAMSIVTNTAIYLRGDMDETFLNMLHQQAILFAASDHLVMMKINENGKPMLYRKYDFSLLDEVKTLELLKQLAVDLKSSYYEDVISFEYDGSQFHGFCWNQSDYGYMIGYFVEPEPTETVDDWGDDSIAEYNPHFAAAQQLLGEYENRWNTLLHAKQCGNSVKVEDVKVLKQQIAELRDTTVYGEVRDGADQLMSKIKKWNIR